mmetsp:Transcript_20294/g.65377  ORF Transcript_20294/g.65377 Transcript_20294/m.65377 type:complete len:230 (+) Transcript_20294:393-1082(+)
MEGGEGVGYFGVFEESREGGALLGGQARLLLDGGQTDVLRVQVVGVPRGRRVADFVEVGSRVHVVDVAGSSRDVQISDHHDGRVLVLDVGFQGAVPALRAIVEAAEVLSGVGDVGRHQRETTEVDPEEAAFVRKRVSLKGLFRDSDVRLRQGRDARVALLRRRATEVAMAVLRQQLREAFAHVVDVLLLELVLVQQQQVRVLVGHNLRERIDLPLGGVHRRPEPRDVDG